MRWESKIDADYVEERMVGHAGRTLERSITTDYNDNGLLMLQEKRGRTILKTFRTFLGHKLFYIAFTAILLCIVTWWVA